MELQTITAETYEMCISDHPQKDFLQSSFEGKKMEYDGWQVYYLAGIEDRYIKVCAMVCLRPLMKFFTYAYLPRGPIYDTNKPEDLEDFYPLLVPFLKEKRCVYLETDPNVPLQERDKDGKIVEGGWNNFDLVQRYKKMHFQHLPLRQGYDLSKQCRWMSVLDLRKKSKEEIFASFSSKTRQNVKSALKNQIQIRLLKKEELSILYDIVKETGDRRHFTSLSLEYYQEQYDFFGDHAQAYYAYIDLDAYLKDIQQRMAEEKETIRIAREGLENNPHSKNSKNRLKTANDRLRALEKREVEAKELQEEHGKELGLAAAMFLYYGEEIVYLMSGSRDMYKKFKAPYALQWDRIQDAIEQGYKYYNFYGISGYFEPDQEGFGVFDFKRGFDATVVELVGNFILPISWFLYKLYTIKQRRSA